MKIRTRFAPSPTGDLHIGNIRTALYSWLFAKRYNGEFILRIEDTDIDRSNTEFVKSILDEMTWLGINWDKGPYLQTERLERYQQVIDFMLKRGYAYKCFCSSEQLRVIREIQIREGKKPRYPGICRNSTKKNLLNENYTVRFKNPISGSVQFQDKIRGKIIFNNQELDDLIIQRSNGMPTYNFCVVIDDLDMNITHVIRGEDHINNTPRQINILKSLEAKIPIYAHLSMILDENGKKISKRNNSISISECRKNGFLPDALLNYVVRLGWSYGDQEIFSISEMINLFNLNAVSKSASIVNNKKLLWVNKHYIKSASSKKIVTFVKKYMLENNINMQDGPNIQLLVELLKNRFSTLKELAQSCVCFYTELKNFNLIAAKKYFLLKNLIFLEKFYIEINQLNSWNVFNIDQIIMNVSQKIEFNKKNIYMILRLALTGDIRSPSINIVTYVLGKEKVLLRIKNAMLYIKKNHF